LNAQECLAEILRTVQRIEKTLAKGAPAATAPAGPATSIIASDSELDSQYGDPEVRKDPPKWDGAIYAGHRYSQTTPEYLDSLAGFFDWKAGKYDEAANAAPGTPEAEAKVKYARYARKDAARARGWAKRLRAGWKPAAANEGGGDDFTDDADESFT